MTRATPPMPDDPGEVLDETHASGSAMPLAHLHPAARALLVAVMFGAVFVFAYLCRALDLVLDR